MFTAFPIRKPHSVCRKLKATFGAVYNLLDDKMSLKANFYMADQIPYRDETGALGESAVLYDLSLGGSYFFSKRCRCLP
jgi:hypothetical protein